MNSIETFFSAWGMSDPGEQLQAIAACMADDATYADPRTESPLKGHDAIADYISMFAKMAPGATAVVVKQNAHHGVARATVAFRMADGVEQLGQYFIEPGKDNEKITCMVGFVGTGTPDE